MFRYVFFTRHHEIRAGWRIALFFGALSLIAMLAFLPFLGILNGREGLTEGILAICALLASYVMTRFVNRKPFSAIGLGMHPSVPRELGLGLLLGFLMMAAIFIVELGLGYVSVIWRGLSPWETGMALINGLSFFAVAAAAEELLFRGYVFQTLIQGITFLPAMLLMSLVFALAHLANPHVTALSTANVGLAGVWFSFAYMKTRSLWLPMALHFSWNFSQTTLFAFRTSGVATGSRQLFLSVQSGPEWLTGGAFGPEGGVLATALLIACTWYILKSKLVSVPEGIITLDSLEDLIRPGNGTREAAP